MACDEHFPVENRTEKFSSLDFVRSDWREILLNVDVPPCWVKSDSVKDPLACRDCYAGQIVRACFAYEEASPVIQTTYCIHVASDHIDGYTIQARNCNVNQCYVPQFTNQLQTEAGVRQLKLTINVTQ